jgi:hypothetical protein
MKRKQHEPSLRKLIGSVDNNENLTRLRVIQLEGVVKALVEHLGLTPKPDTDAVNSVDAGSEPQ